MIGAGECDEQVDTGCGADFETKIGTGVPDTQQATASFVLPSVYPMAETYDLVVVARFNTEWVGTVDTMRFKVAAHQVRVTEVQDSAAIE